MKRACEEPIRQLVENGGYQGTLVVHKVRSESNSGFGFDVTAGEYGDLLEVGIIDPAKVVRYALVNAASVAGLLLTAEALVAEAPEEPADRAE